MTGVFNLGGGERLDQKLVRQLIMHEQVNAPKLDTTLFDIILPAKLLTGVKHIAVNLGDPVKIPEIA